VTPPSGGWRVRRLLAHVVRLVEWWSVLLLVLMVGIVVAGVFYRYVLDASLAWYDEFASYLLVWLTFYGAVGVAHQRRHISFDTLVERLPPGASRAAAVAAETLVLTFQFVVAYHGWVALDAMAFDTAVSIPWVRMTWVYSVLPIAGTLMLVISAARLVELLRGTGRPAKAPPGHASAE
jgi:TRAP-type C4-dicarboxylate transport system permease small subunit